jgi:hypothetical protein
MCERRDAKSLGGRGHQRRYGRVGMRGGVRGGGQIWYLLHRLLQQQQRLGAQSAASWIP